MIFRKLFSRIFKGKTLEPKVDLGSPIKTDNSEGSKQRKTIIGENNKSQIHSKDREITNFSNSDGTELSEITNEHNAIDEKKSSKKEDENRLNKESLNINVSSEVDAVDKSRNADDEIKLENHFTQFPEMTGEETRLVVMGLDFGTSCSKVVIRIPGMDIITPIKFQTDNGFSYLHPTKIYNTEDGEIFMNPIEDTTVSFNLKIPFIKRAGINETDVNTNAQEEEKEKAVGYLAYVIGLSRRYFMEQHRETIKYFKIDWNLNIGIPSAGFDNENEMEIFKELALAAWWVSTQESNITSKLVLEGIQRAASDKSFLDIHREAVNVIPEIIAQVSGYAKSDQGKDGLYILIDIGASTLDASTFIIEEKEEEIHYKFCSAITSALGAYELHLRRLSIFEKFKGFTLKDFLTIDPMISVPENLSDYLSPENVLKLKEPYEEEEEIARECRKVIRKSWKLAKDGDEGDHPDFKDGITTFLCGGGHKLRFYKMAVKEIDYDLTYKHKLGSLRLMELPIPDTIKSQGIDTEDYHRISVAFGLSLAIDEFDNVRSVKLYGDYVPTIEPYIHNSKKFEEFGSISSHSTR